MNAKRHFVPGAWGRSGRAVANAEPFCCSGECSQGRTCPLVVNRAPIRGKSAALRVLVALAVLVSACMSAGLIVGLAERVAR